MRNIHFLVFIFILFLVVFTENTAAQNANKKSVYLTGYVKDTFTELGIPETQIYLLATDSTVIDSQTVREIKSNNYAITTFVMFQMPKQTQKLIVKAVHPHYNTTYVDYYLKPKGRMAYYNLPEINMLKKRKNMEGKLGEVVVQATKVKMVYKGDTLIYNADAFNIPDGSMLGNLIRQMPGTEIDANGVITVNGRKVDYLALNGKKLFNGNNKVMMDNLPYYIVKNLKVFEQAKEEDFLLGKTNREKEYIMDVVLKPEYNVKSFGNIDAGAGSEKRYLGHAFGALNSNYVNGIGYGNINNVNETELPGNNGWSLGFNSPRSIEKNKQIGASGTIERKNLNDNFGFRGVWTDNDTDIKQTQETYLSGLSKNNVVRKLMDWNNKKKDTYSFENELKIRRPIFIGLETKIQYAREGNHTYNQNATFDGMPTYNTTIQDLFDSIHAHYNYALQQELVNSTTYKHWGNKSSWNARQSAYTNFNLPWGDDIRIDADVSYHHDEASQDEQQAIIYYRSKAETAYDYLAKENTTNEGYSYNIKGRYNYNLSAKETVTLKYGFGQMLAKKERERYRNNADNNSYHHTNFSRENSLEIGFYTQSRNDLRFDIALGIDLYNQNMNYIHAVLDTTFHRNYADLLPAMSIRWDTRRGERLTFNTELQTTRKPTVIDLIDITDDSNPLIHYQGNPYLKKEQMYTYSLGYARSSSKHEYTFNVTAKGGFYFDRIASSILYNEKNGTYTYRPQNMNGDWYGKFDVSIGRTLDKRNVLRLQNNFSYAYNRLSDMTGTSELRLTKINMHTVFDKITLSYQSKKLRMSGVGYLSWQHSLYPELNCEDLDIYNFGYGFNMNYDLPWNIQLAGDFMMYSHRGYSSGLMNTNDLIGNISLSRSFLKYKQLTCKLIAYDIFHQYTQQEYSQNAQGWTETFYNCIPRYIMLTLSYRFGNFKK